MSFMVLAVMVWESLWFMAWNPTKGLGLVFPVR